MSIKLVNEVSNYEIVSTSAEDTKEIATFLATQLQAGDVITLEGDLGTGKTTFTKGLAHGLAIKRAVTSPTFTIIKEYKGKLPLYHMDAYRLEYSEEDIGFDEYFYGNGISVVEWPSFIEEYLPTQYLSILITAQNMETRSIRFIPKGKRYEKIVHNLRNRKQINK